MSSDKACIRIVHVIHYLNMGGAENLLVNLHKNIDRSKIQFDYIVHEQKPGYFDSTVKELGGKIYYLPAYTIKNTAEYKKACDSLLSKHPEWKVMHGHLGGPSFIYLKSAKKHGIYTVIHSHNSGPQPLTIKNVLRRIFTYASIYIADYFMACSLDAGNYYFSKKITKNKQKFCVINNGIDVKKYLFDIKVRDDIEKEFHLKKDDIVIGCVARFSEQKNHTFLIDIFNQLAKTNNNYKLLLVGGGNYGSVKITPLEKFIRDKVDSLGLSDRVIFTGVRNDVNKLLQRIDCFVMTSLFEGLGIVLIEAQAASVPCVVSDTIPKEAEMTTLVDFCSLKASTEVWAKKIENSLKTDRYNINFDKLQSNYDIRYISDNLTKFYLSKIN